MARPRTYNHDIRCPHCGSNWTPKDGHSRGKQTYRCGDCRYRFTPDGNRHYYPEATIRQALNSTVKEGAYRLWRAQWTSTSLLCSPGSKKASWAQRALDIERRRRTPSEPELSATVRKIRGIDAHRRRAKVISFDEMWTYVDVCGSEKRREAQVSVDMDRCGGGERRRALDGL